MSLKATASQVSQALRLAATGHSNDRVRRQILITYADLCAVFDNDEIPYGILLGYAFQTETPIEQHHFRDSDGRKILYIMPKMKHGQNARAEQFIDIVKQVSLTCNKFCLGVSQGASSVSI